MLQKSKFRWINKIRQFLLFCLSFLLINAFWFSFLTPVSSNSPFLTNGNGENSNMNVDSTNQPLPFDIPPENLPGLISYIRQQRNYLDNNSYYELLHTLTQRLNRTESSSSQNYDLEISKIFNFFDFQTEYSFFNDGVTFNIQLPTLSSTNSQSSPSLSQLIKIFSGFYAEFQQNENLQIQSQEISFDTADERNYLRDVLEMFIGFEYAKLEVNVDISATANEWVNISPVSIYPMTTQFTVKSRTINYELLVNLFQNLIKAMYQNLNLEEKSKLAWDRLEQPMIINQQKIQRLLHQYQTFEDLQNRLWIQIKNLFFNETDTDAINFEIVVNKGNVRETNNRTFWQLINRIFAINWTDTDTCGPILACLAGPAKAITAANEVRKRINDWQSPNFIRWLNIFISGFSFLNKIFMARIQQDTTILPTLTFSEIWNIIKTLNLDNLNNPILIETMGKVISRWDNLNQQLLSQWEIQETQRQEIADILLDQWISYQTFIQSTEQTPREHTWNSNVAFDGILLPYEIHALAEANDVIVFHWVSSANQSNKLYTAAIQINEENEQIMDIIYFANNHWEKHLNDFLSQIFISQDASSSSSNPGN